jgi:uncharacterized protein (DUF2147 family)
LQNRRDADTPRIRRGVEIHVSAAFVADTPSQRTWRINMKKIIVWSAWLIAALSPAWPALAQTALNAAPENGRWVTESGNLEVEIAPCGQALCGTVVKVIANRSMSKPNAAMTPADSRSPLGMQILTDLVPSGSGEWKGRVYNRENGETYDCLMSLASADQLKIHGYKGVPLFGKTQIWRRVSDEGKQ